MTIRFGNSRSPNLNVWKSGFASVFIKTPRGYLKIKQFQRMLLKSGSFLTHERQSWLHELVALHSSTSDNKAHKGSENTYANLASRMFFMISAHCHSLFLGK